MGYYAATVADSLITRAAIEDLVRNPLALEERDDAAQLVPRLSNPSFVRAARVLHREQRLDLLLAHATPEQLTGLMDLEAWTGQRLHLPRARGWLAAIADAMQAAMKPPTAASFFPASPPKRPTRRPPANDEVASAAKGPSTVTIPSHKR